MIVIAAQWFVHKTALRRNSKIYKCELLFFYQVARRDLLMIDKLDATNPTLRGALYYDKDVPSKIKQLKLAENSWIVHGKIIKLQNFVVIKNFHKKN